MKCSIITLTVLFMATVAIVSAETDCQRHRARESSSTNRVPGRVIAECDEKGDYLPRQCHRGPNETKRFCQCWDKNGYPLTSPSTKNRACDCIVSRHEANKNVSPGTFVPKCNDTDGTFLSIQNHGSTGMQWCADPITGKKLTEPSRSTPTCPKP